jgi:hypothetical protein
VAHTAVLGIDYCSAKDSKYLVDGVPLPYALTVSRRAHHWLPQASCVTECICARHPVPTLHSTGRAV